MTARVVLADDVQVVRLGLRPALHAPPLPVEVVGETDNLAHLHRWPVRS
jgi:DNA-binding NarL/FixJ family response regulator